MADVVGKNGKIDGFFAAQVLLGEDLFFFNDGEIVFDGSHHIIRGIQINGEKINEIPGLLENAQALAMGLADCMMTVEQNEKLFCPISEIDDELKPFIYDENLTGITLMHLFAWHLLKIVEGDSMGDALEAVGKESVSKHDFTIVGDTRVLNGIPDSHKLIDELIHSLLRYNDDDREISVNYIGMRNFDV